MPKCVKCGCNFPSRERIEGKVKNLTRRRYCLKCLPFKMHKPSKEGIKTICNICGRQYVYNKKQGHTTTKCNSCVVNQRRFRIKKRALEYKGGACQKCGYNKCERVLSFHHRSDLTKEFGISQNHARSWESIQKELDKCDLLCANCHMEIHDKEESKRGITPLWCEKEKDPERNTTLCPICGKWIKNKKYCSGNCAHYANRKVLRPSREELEEILRKESLVSIGRKYRVSDNTIKKWAKGYGLVLKTRSYNRSANI